MAVDQNSRPRPKITIDKTIEEFRKMEGKVIVEIGSMRMYFNHPLDEINHECCNDGHSSALWARTGAEFYAVDVEPAVVDNTRKIIEERNLGTNATILCQDGLEFLRNFEKKIDLLYLDAWDVDLPNSAERHLEAYFVARPKLNNRHLILIDDTDLYWDGKEFQHSMGAFSGKGALMVPQAIKDGYELIFSGRQTLLRK